MRLGAGAEGVSDTEIELHGLLCVLLGVEVAHAVARVRIVAEDLRLRCLPVPVVELVVVVAVAGWGPLMPMPGEDTVLVVLLRIREGSQATTWRSPRML
jgi:hypothetical protein